MNPESAIKLLDEMNDFELCDGVYCAAADFTGNKIDFLEENEPLRTISMVWLAAGVIGNGGFTYLLEHACGGDVGYKLMADAFVRIGADRCAEAFCRTFALFPSNNIIDDHK